VDAESVGLAFCGRSLLAQPHVQDVECPRSEAHRADPSLLVGRDDSGVLQDAEVLHERRQRHGERCREFGYDGGGLHQALDDGPARGIRESAEHGVELVVILRHIPNYCESAAIRQPRHRRPETASDGDCGDNERVTVVGGSEPVRLTLLGRFEIAVGSRCITAADWPMRRAAELVQLLALANGYHLLREQVIEALWPHLAPDAGAANLRKAAHDARQVVGDPGAVALRGGRVSLFPARRVETDVARFVAAAMTCADVDAGAAADTYAGDLLPDALYAEWAAPPRDRLRSLHRDLLRRAGRWAELFAADPTDEVAARGVMLMAVRSGQRHAAIRAYGQLRSALASELGIRPDPETEELRRQCIEGIRPPRPAALIGRELVLTEALAALAAGDRGEQTALVVRGPAGIGKSAICHQLVVAAREQGRLVVAVHAVPDAGPYAPLVAAVETLLERVPGALERVPGRTRSVLAELSPLVAPGPPLDGPVTRHQVIGAVRRLVVAAAAERPALLVVDDADLAGDDAVHALLHLAGVQGVARPFLVLTYRPGRVRDRLSQGVARLLRARAACAIDVPPLADDDAATLVRTVAGAPVADEQLGAILGSAAGNPFFLLELARARTADDRWATLAARLAEFGDAQRVMLQRLAVAGGDLDPDAVLAISGLPEDDAFALLDEALAAEILVVSGARYVFRHDLVRQMLVEKTPPHHRIAVHRDAARRLSSSGGRPAAIGAHWLAAGRPEEAAPWLVEAARDAVRLGAFGDALNHADLVLSQLGDRADALLLRAECLEALGVDGAPAAYAAAARVADKTQWHEIRAKQALASVRTGDPAGGMAVLADVHATTLEGRLAQALALAGAAAMGFADPAVGIADAAATRALAVASGRPAAVIIATWAEAAAAHAAGDLPNSLRAVLAHAHSLPDLAITLFDGQLCVAERLLYGNQPYDQVIRFADGLEAESDRLGAARGKAFATTFRGEAKLLMGELDDAAADLGRGVELHRAIGAAGGEALSLQRLAEVALHRGQREDAKRLVDEALTIARESNMGFHLFDRIYGTRIAAASGPAEAMAVLEEAEDAVHGSMETCPGCRISLAVPAAIAAADAGDLDRAVSYEQVATDLTAILMRLPGWYAALDEVRGHRALAAGDVAEARTHLTDAARAFQVAGQPLDARRCADAATVLVSR
jgi:DNA-binding SARP family transcriptional activator/tetratricopeptide (TPR) repeat protein